MTSRSVTCHPADVTFPPLPQPKMVLEGCKAELSYGAASGIPVGGGTQLMVLTDRHDHHDTPLRYSGVVGSGG